MKSPNAKGPTTPRQRIKDPGKTVKDYLHEAGPGIAVTGFHRYHLGEEGK